MSKLRSGVMGLALAGSMIALSGAVLADGPGYSIKDTPAPAPFSWTGFYVGVNAGHAWGNSDFGSSYSCPAAGTCPVNVPANLANFTTIGGGSLSPSGFTGGVQAGYNWQSGSAVLGIETDFNSFRLSDSRTNSVASTTTVSIFTTTTSVDTDWLYTLRGRLGWTVTPTTLLYVTGGLAVADVKVNNFASVTAPGPASGGSSHSATLTGWTIGGGIEWALDSNWTLKSEYLFVDLGTVSTTANVTGVGFATPNAYSTSADLTAHMTRVGLNYKF